MSEPINGQIIITGEEVLKYGESKQLSLLEAIEFAIGREEGLRRQVKTAREMLESELLQSDEYKKAKEQAKLARQELKTAKMRVMQSALCQELAEKLDELKADAKAEKDTLAATALVYAEQTKEDTVMRGEDTYRIIKLAKLKKEKSEKRRKN